MTTKQTFTPKITKTGKPVARNVGEMWAKAKTHTVVCTAPGQYEVTSGESGDTYKVSVFQGQAVMEGATAQTLRCTCGCDYGQYHASECACSHTLAAVRFALANKGLKATGTANSPVAARKAHRRTYYAGEGVWVNVRPVA
jgi:hypothetical protein